MNRSYKYSKSDNSELVVQQSFFHVSKKWWLSINPWIYSDLYWFFNNTPYDMVILIKVFMASVLLSLKQVTPTKQNVSRKGQIHGHFGFLVEAFNAHLVFTGFLFKFRM